MLMRPIQAHSCMFARAPVYACAPASRAHPLLQAIFSHALSRVFQEPKTLPEYKHIEPPYPLSPSPGKNKYFLLKHRHLEAGLFLALPRCAPPPPPASRQPQDALRTDAASAETLEAHDATERETKKPRHQDAHGKHALSHHTLASQGHLARPPILKQVKRVGPGLTARGMRLLIHSDLALMMLTLQRDLHHAHAHANTYKIHRQRYRRLYLFCTSLPPPQKKGGRGGVAARSSSSKNPQLPQQQLRPPGAKRNKYTSDTE
jgi:hypothetical protein